MNKFNLKLFKERVQLLTSRDLLAEYYKTAQDIKHLENHTGNPDHVKINATLNDLYLKAAIMQKQLLGRLNPVVRVSRIDDHLLHIKLFCGQDVFENKIGWSKTKTTWNTYSKKRKALGNIGVESNL